MSKTSYFSDNNLQTVLHNNHHAINLGALVLVLSKKITVHPMVHGSPGMGDILFEYKKLFCSNLSGEKKPSLLEGFENAFL